MCTYSFWRHLWPRIKQLKQIFGKKKNTQKGEVSTLNIHGKCRKSQFFVLCLKSHGNRKKSFSLQGWCEYFVQIP